MMLQQKLRHRVALGCVAALAMFFSGNSQVNAWWHHGSSGSSGSSGGWFSSGSSGGWFHGSSGGWLHHHHSSGSSGGWYSSGSSGNGGSSGGWYSYSSPSYGGSAGGSSWTPSYSDGCDSCVSSYSSTTPMVYSTPYYEGSASPMYSIPAGGGVHLTPGPAAEGTTPMAGQLMSTLRAMNGSLVVNVPADAKVFVNGLPTTSTGSQRTYVSKGLIPGQTYTYEVRAEIVRNGKTVSDTKSVKLTAGQEYAVAFSLDSTNERVSSDPQKTKLTLRVPASAKVTLAGRETNTPGEVREFTTSKLAPGSIWDNYTVVVTVERNGQLVKKEQTISLEAGENREMSFDFDSAQVATNDVVSTR